MERRISPLFGVFSKNPLQVQLFSHQAQYKVHQMPRWYPIQHRWRHQLILFWNPISKCLRHAPIQFLSTVKYGPHYLDRLFIGADACACCEWQCVLFLSRVSGVVIYGKTSSMQASDLVGRGCPGGLLAFYLAGRDGLVLDADGIAVELRIG